MGKLVATRKYTISPRPFPIDIKKYEETYRSDLLNSVSVVKDLQKYEWEVEIKFTDNSDDIMLSKIMEEAIPLYYHGFRKTINQYMRENKCGMGRTKIKGMVGRLMSTMKSIQRQVQKKKKHQMFLEKGAAAQFKRHRTYSDIT